MIVRGPRPPLSSWISGICCWVILGTLSPLSPEPELLKARAQIRVRVSSLPPSATLDLRILKYFNVKGRGKLDVVAEAFNLLNRTNVTRLNTVYGPLLTPVASFGRPIEAGPGRQLQFSIDFEF